MQVLRWYGYFKEAVTESAVENFRVRKVVIFFYLEDNSCQVVEPKEDNSGLPQVLPLPCPATSLPCPALCPAQLPALPCSTAPTGLLHPTTCVEQDTISVTCNLQLLHL